MITNWTRFVPIETELTLSTGEKLCNLTNAELKELHGSVGKLFARMGRTPHYARKNRSNLDIYERDNAQIEAEMRRRTGLCALEYAGHLWHWAGQVEELRDPDSNKKTQVEKWISPIYLQGRPVGESVHRTSDLYSTLIVQTKTRLEWEKDGIAKVVYLPDPLGGSYDLSTLMADNTDES